MGELHSNILLLVFAAAATPLCRADETLDTAPIISALMDVTEDADVEVRYVAFEALKTQPRSEELLELFWRSIEDESWKIRNLCLDYIVKHEGPTNRVVTRLVSLQEKAKNSNEQGMAEAAQRHLVTIGAPAIPYLIEALKRDESNYYAVSALGQIPLDEHRDTVATRLTDLLKSKDKAVQLAAVRSLQSIMRAEAKRMAEAQAVAEAQTKGIEPRYLAFYTKLLQKYDSNGDGSLTEDEWSKMSKDPAAADADRDGRITAVELGKWSMFRR